MRRPQDSLLTKSETAELEGGEQSPSENYDFQSMRNGHVEALAELCTLWRMQAMTQMDLCGSSSFVGILVEHATTVPAGIWAV